jgi:dihydroneopterin aldolase
MLVKVGFDRLPIDGELGVFYEERGTIRRYYISARFTYDAELAVSSTRLEHALDYYELANGVRALAQKKSFGLIEELAAEIVDWVFLSYSHVRHLYVFIEKTDAIELNVSGLLEINISRQDWKKNRNRVNRR